MLGNLGVQVHPDVNPNDFKRVCLWCAGKVDDHNWGKNVVDIAEALDKDAKLAEKLGRQGQYLAAEILHPDNIERCGTIFSHSFAMIKALKQPRSVEEVRPVLSLDFDSLHHHVQVPDQFSRTAKPDNHRPMSSVFPATDSDKSCGSRRQYVRLIGDNEWFNHTYL